MIEIRTVFQHLALSGPRILFACPSLFVAPTLSVFLAIIEC